MKFVNDVLMALIIGSAVYMLYRAIWKNKGQCPDCSKNHKNKKVFK